MAWGHGPRPVSGKPGSPAASSSRSCRDAQTVSGIREHVFVESDGPGVAAAYSRSVVVLGAACLGTVGGFAAWLTGWALSQAAAVSNAGYVVEGWILAARPALIPVSMVIAWILAERSTARGWSRTVRVLGTGAAISVILLFLDGVLSAGL